MFLVDVVVETEAFELVVAAFAAGESGGVDQRVVGQHRCGQAVAVSCCLKGFDNDVAANG